MSVKAILTGQNLGSGSDIRILSAVIPRGRMRGDADGDGVFTLLDKGGVFPVHWLKKRRVRVWMQRWSWWRSCAILLLIKILPILGKNSQFTFFNFQYIM